MDKICTIKVKTNHLFSVLDSFILYKVILLLSRLDFGKMTKTKTESHFKVLYELAPSRRSKIQKGIQDCLLALTKPC